MFRYKQSALLNLYPIQYMYVFFFKWNSFGIVPFQDNMQFNSHSFDSISCQFVIPPQFTLKVENSIIIPIQTYTNTCILLHIKIRKFKCLFFIIMFLLIHKSYQPPSSISFIILIYFLLLINYNFLGLFVYSHFVKKNHFKSFFVIIFCLGEYKLKLFFIS